METVMTAPLNRIFVLDTQYGKHIVKVTDRTEPVLKKRVAILEKEAIASKETFNKYYSQANNVAAKAAGKYEGFTKRKGFMHTRSTGCLKVLTCSGQ